MCLVWLKLSLKLIKLTISCWIVRSIYHWYFKNFIVSYGVNLKNCLKIRVHSYVMMSQASLDFCDLFYWFLGACCVVWLEGVWDIIYANDPFVILSWQISLIENVIQIIKNRFLIRYLRLSSKRVSSSLF